MRPSLIAAILVLGSFAVFAGTDEPATYNASDNYWYVPTAQSLIADGDFDLRQQYSALIAETRDWNWMSVDLNGGRYNYFGFGTSVLILPVVTAGNRIYRADRGFDRDLRIAALAARVIAAVSVGALFLVAWQLSRRRGLAAALACLFAVATPHLSIHAGGLWSHNAVLLFELVALLALAKGGRWAWVSIVPLAFAFYCRPTAAIPIGLTFGYFLLQRRWRDAAWFGLAGLALLAAMLWQWHSAMGVWLPPYYGGQNFAFAVSTRGYDHVLTALSGHLLSPNRGLFVFMPVAILSVAGAVLAWRRSSAEHGVYCLMGAWACAHWFLISSYPHWWLGHSFGPRSWAEMTGLLVLLLLPVWPSLLQRPRARAAVLALALVFVALGAFVNGRGAFCTGMQAWNSTPADVDVHPERIWDWRDLQFMRGTCGP